MSYEFRIILLILLLYSMWFMLVIIVDGHAKKESHGYIHTEEKAFERIMGKWINGWIGNIMVMSVFLPLGIGAVLFLMLCDWLSFTPEYARKIRYRKK